MVTVNSMDGWFVRHGVCSLPRKHPIAANCGWLNHYCDGDEQKNHKTRKFTTIDAGNPCGVCKKGSVYTVAIG